MDSIGLIVLAAGGSSRLGRPKQLLPWNGKPLIAHIVDEGISPLVVVTGAVDVTAALAGRDIHHVDNPHWADGMASSIRTGLRYLLALNPDTSAVILSVCDQPFITRRHFECLIAEQTRAAKGIIASGYAGTLGTPVLFTQCYFPELLALTGGQGAKQLLSAFPTDVASVPFPRGGIDIDTEEDYLALT